MLKKNSWKLITVCWSMFITICCPTKINLWGDGAMINDLTPQCESEELKSPHLQPRLT
jgi:hypothetical protein